MACFFSNFWKLSFLNAPFSANSPLVGIRHAQPCHSFTFADMEDLKTFAKTQGAIEANELSHWDMSFWAERLRESRYDINEVGLLFPPLLLFCVFLKHIANLVC